METRGYGSMHAQETPDSILIHRVLAGDQKAFEALVCRYQRSLLRLIYRYVGEYHEAQDILQQVWIQLYLSLPTLPPQMRVKPWLFTVARNRSLDFLRRRKLLSFSAMETVDEEDQATFQDTIIDMSPTPEELVEQRDLQFAIQCAIQTLPHIYRPVVLLYYREHMNNAEIGQVLEVPVSTVKARFHRAKPFLRAALTAL